MIYEPREDSFLLEKEVRLCVKNKTFLDMGAGSGIQSRAARDSGAKSVLAVDINPECVKEIKRQKIRALKSDLFSNIKEKFDIIAFNPPYLPESSLEDKESSIVTTGGKKGDEIILRFLKDAPRHLSKNGFILLLVSSLTPKKKILSLLNKKSLNYQTLSSEKLFFEQLEVWRVSPKTK
jgi:release factor glutamine methyltransferase